MNILIPTLGFLIAPDKQAVDIVVDIMKAAGSHDEQVKSVTTLGPVHQIIL